MTLIILTLNIYFLKQNLIIFDNQNYFKMWQQAAGIILYAS